MAFSQRAFVSNPSRAPGDGPSVRILCYNVLAQELCDDGYEYCPKSALRPAYRRDLLLRELSDSRADIICLQEVERDSSDAIEEHLSALGYEASSYCRNRGSDEILGLRTFWRTDAFELINDYQLPIRTLARNSARRGRAPTRVGGRGAGPLSPTGSTGSGDTEGASAAAAPPHHSAGSADASSAVTPDGRCGTPPTPASPSAASAAAASAASAAHATPSAASAAAAAAVTATSDSGGDGGAAAWTREQIVRHYELWDWLQSMHHVGQAVVLRPRSVPRCSGGSIGSGAASLLVVANAHLYWNPRWPEVKALQAALIVDAIDELRQRLCMHYSGGDGGGVSGGGASGPASLAALATNPRVNASPRGRGGRGGSRGGRRSAALISAAAASAIETPAAPPLLPAPPGTPGPAVVFCGDFNSLPLIRERTEYDSSVPLGGLVSGVYSLLSTGSLATSHPHHPAARRGLHPSSVTSMDLPMRFTSAYAAALGREPLWTNWHRHDFRETLDYVWVAEAEAEEGRGAGEPQVSDGGGQSLLEGAIPTQCTAAPGGRKWAPLAGLRAHAAAALDVPTDAAVHAHEGGAAGGCPNAGMPSDHILIAVELVLWRRDGTASGVASSGGIGGSVE